MARSFNPSNNATSRSSFDESQSTESGSKNVSRSPSKSRTLDEAETTDGPLSQDRPQDDSTESPQQDGATGASKEPKWPTDWRAYRALLGGFLLMFNSWGLVNAYGTYSSYYIQDLLPGQDILLLNLVGSTQSFMVLALSAVVGRFLDAGYIRILIIIGTFFVSLGWFLLSIVNGDAQYGQGNYGLIWLTQGFVSGLGMACFFVSSSQVVGTWFVAKKSLAIGIVASGASISGLIYPYMTRELINQDGFNNATRYVATVICVTCIMAIFTAVPNPKWIVRKPKKWTFEVFVDTAAYRNRAYSWFCAAITIMFFGFYAIFFNLEEWAVSEGFGFREANNVGANSNLLSRPAEDRIQTYWLLAIMNASSTLGRIGAAYVSDKWGALNVHCGTTTVAAILTLCLWPFANDLDSALAFVVIFGAFSGSVIGLPPASVANILGKSPEQQAKLGQWTGMMYTGAAIFALSGPVIAGHLITEFGSFLTVQMWSGACLALSAACMGCSIWCHNHGDMPPDVRARREAEKALRAGVSVSTASSHGGDKVEPTTQRETV